MRADDVFQKEWEAGEPSSLPLNEYLRAACDYAAGLVDGTPWPSPLWHFTRAVKGHPELRNATARVALANVESWLRIERTTWASEFEVVADEDAQMEFATNWDKIRFVPGEAIIDTAVKRAKASGFLPKNCYTAGYALFISVAAWLQKAKGDEPIMLPCRLLSKRLGCEPMTVSRYRQAAMAEGLLTVITQHRFNSHGGGQATEFRFNLQRFPEITRIP